MKTLTNRIKQPVIQPAVSSAFLANLAIEFSHNLPNIKYPAMDEHYGYFYNKHKRVED